MKPTSDMTTVGISERARKVALLREQKILEVRALRGQGWTQQRIADLFGTSQATVRKWLNNTECENCGVLCSASLCKSCVHLGGGQDPAVRFFAKVEKRPDGCWYYTGGQRPDGYGHFWFEGHNVQAHRWSYEYAVGAIGDGLQIDHTCCNPPCVNPAHLEPVTPRVNTLRSSNPAALNERKTECAHGHPFTPENTYVSSGGRRHCRECNRRRCRDHRARRSA